MTSRRTLLRAGLAAGLVGSAAALANEAGGFGTQLASARPRPGTPVEPFTTAFAVPPVLRPFRRDASTDYYRMVTHRTRESIVSRVKTDVLTYNGVFGGPTIKARSGRRVVVEQHNMLSAPTSMHLHGGVTHTDSDGGTMGTEIAPGGRRTYEYLNRQPAATLWMHDHTHHREAEHVYRGLSGLYLLGDAEEDSLGLPSGDFDVPLVLRDAAFDKLSQMTFSLDDPVTRTTMLVNGKPWPQMRVSARKYRFRIVNASNLRFFVLRLSDGSPVTQIAVDGGLLEAPYSTPVVVLSPGERADVVVDFTGYSPGTQVVLENLLTGFGPAELTGRVMRFEVGAPQPDFSTVPSKLATLPALATPTVHRSFVMAMEEPAAPGSPPPPADGHHAGGHGGGAGGHMATINGLSYDHGRIDTTVQWGTTEVWSVTNANPTIPHNFHTHLVNFRVLERDGQPVSPAESGFKDTVQIFAGQTVKLLLTFDSHRGVYPYHCHMIDHSAMGMMGQMEIV